MAGRRPRRGRAPGRRPLRPRGPCAAGGQPWARFFSLAVELSDDNAPSIGLTAPAGHTRGAIALAVSARDEGGGVYERALELDGRRLATARLCATVPSTIGAQRHVTSRVPCPLDAPTAVPLDTRTLADGAHTLVAPGRGRRRQHPHRERAGSSSTTSRRDAGTVTLAGDPSEALTAQPSGFNGEDTTYDYRWERCDDAGCTEIGGAVSRTYGAPPARRGPPPPRGRHRHRRWWQRRVASQQSEPIPAPAVAPRRRSPAAI